MSKYDIGDRVQFCQWIKETWGFTDGTIIEIDTRSDAPYIVELDEHYITTNLNTNEEHVTTKVACYGDNDILAIFEATNEEVEDTNE